MHTYGHTNTLIITFLYENHQTTYTRNIRYETPVTLLRFLGVPRYCCPFGLNPAWRGIPTVFGVDVVVIDDFVTAQTIHTKALTFQHEKKNVTNASHKPQTNRWVCSRFIYARVCVLTSVIVSVWCLTLAYTGNGMFVRKSIGRTRRNEPAHISHRNDPHTGWYSKTWFRKNVIDF